MMSAAGGRPPSDPFLILRRPDQPVVALCVAIGLVALASQWIRAGCRGRLVEFDDLAPASARFEVDLNTAEWPELAQLPEIGETLARRIVEYRDANGPFQRVEDLDRVPGIGKATIEKVRPYLKGL